jgi:hypothetical protein
MLNQKGADRRRRRHSEQQVIYLTRSRVFT